MCRAAQGGRDRQLRHLEADRRGLGPAVGHMLIHCVPPVMRFASNLPAHRSASLFMPWNRAGWCVNVRSGQSGLLGARTRPECGSVPDSDASVAFTKCAFATGTVVSVRRAIVTVRAHGKFSLLFHVSPSVPFATLVSDTRDHYEAFHIAYTRSVEMPQLVSRPERWWLVALLSGPT